MLYSIIPPILIVISLAGIIVFLVKKAPEVASFSEENKKNDGDFTIQKKSFWSKIWKKEESEEKKDFGHNTLLFLEKFLKKIKVFFLKMENTFALWSESIKNKRKAREEEKLTQNLEPSEGERNLVQGKKQKRFFSRDPKKQNDKAKKTEIKEEKNNGEILLSRKVETKKKIEKKDMFEKILVERIAANPKDVEAYERLGEYYLEIENWNYAKECFKQVLKLNPQNINVKGKMRRLEKMLGR